MCNVKSAASISSGRISTMLGVFVAVIAHFCVMAEGISFETLRIKAADLPGVTGHAQGMCASDTAMFISTHNAIVKVDWSGKVLAVRRFESHMGDLAFHDGRVYCTWAHRKDGKTEPTILVLDGELKDVARRIIPDIPGCDGITVLGNRIYFGVGRGLMNAHRVNTLGMLDMDFNVIGYKDVDFGVDTNFGAQNICAFDGRIYAFFYTHLGKKKGLPLKCCILDKDLNVISAEPFAAGMGIDVAPVRFGGTPQRPIFVKSHTIGKIDRNDPAAVYITLSFWTYADGKSKSLAPASGKHSKTEGKDKRP